MTTIRQQLDELAGQRVRIVYHNTPGDQEPTVATGILERSSNRDV